MNTDTHHETQALQAITAAVAAHDLLLIPLSQLRPSSRNVRKSGGTSIPELASSIARVGLLQKLTVTASTFCVQAFDDNEMVCEAAVTLAVVRRASVEMRIASKVHCNPSAEKIAPHRASGAPECDTHGCAGW